jgi:hypothetical protein
MKQYQFIHNQSVIVSIKAETTYKDDTGTTRKAYCLSSNVIVDAGVFHNKYKPV